MAGCSVLVLEQAATPSSPLKMLPFGLRGLTTPTIESLDRRGLLDAIKDRAANRDIAKAAHWMTHERRPAGHFAGIPIFHDQLERSASPYNHPATISSLAVDLASIEAVLANRAAELGVDIRWDCAVRDVTSSPHSVVVQAGGTMVRGRWLVGCDGGRSVVRKSTGIGFSGTAAEFNGYSVTVELTESGRLPPGRHLSGTGMYVFTPPDTLAMVDFDGGTFHRTVPITRDHVETVLRRISLERHPVGARILDWSRAQVS